MKSPEVILHLLPFHQLGSGIALNTQTRGLALPGAALLQHVGLAPEQGAEKIDWGIHHQGLQDQTSACLLHRKLAKLSSFVVMRQHPVTGRSFLPDHSNAEPPPGPLWASAKLRRPAHDTERHFFLSSG